MSQWKLPRIRTITPPPIDSPNLTDNPHRQDGDERLRLLNDLEIPSAYSRAPSQENAIQLTASFGEKRSIWRKPPAETTQQDGQPRKATPDQIAEMLSTYSDRLKSDSGSLHYTDSIALIRFARDHLVTGGPFIEETFEVAVWMLKESNRTLHLGNRHLAAKLMTHINPLLPDMFPPAYPAAEMLRSIIIEQEDDAATHIQAYTGLIHCFSAEEIEVTEGLAIFEGLATRGRTGAIAEEARFAYWKMVEVRSPKLHRRPKP